MTLLLIVVVICGGYMFVASKFNNNGYLDHVNFLAGTLGTGKTSVAVYFARKWAKSKREDKSGAVYTNFVCENAKPLNTVTGEWPKEPYSLIILDEILFLEANGALPYGWLAEGLTMARHYRQKVILLCQGHRPPFPRKFWGTIGAWVMVRGISIGKRGRFVMLRWSAEPFTRMKGYKGLGVRLSCHWISADVFSTYNSHDIWGLSAEVEGNAAHVPPASAGGRGARVAAPRRHRVSRSS